MSDKGFSRRRAAAIAGGMAATVLVLIGARQNGTHASSSLAELLSGLGYGRQIAAHSLSPTRECRQRRSEQRQSDSRGPLVRSLDETGIHGRDRNRRELLLPQRPSRSAGGDQSSSLSGPISGARARGYVSLKSVPSL
jgi:hypothetical protein